MNKKSQKPRSRTRRPHAVILKFQPVTLKAYKPPKKRRNE